MAGSVTELLIDWSKGDQSALERLMAIVYKELHELAENQMHRERFDHTLQTTELVNEAFIRLIDLKKIDLKSRAQFFALAAQLMRNILIDHARSHMAAKRGGGILKLPLSDNLKLMDESDIGILDLDEALKSLEKVDSQQSRIVELRYFGGLTVDEIAEVLQISPATVGREWRHAKAWLLRKITKQI
jgi:RNA polymerase sigma factor (TIGR02999 family)